MFNLRNKFRYYFIRKKSPLMRINVHDEDGDFIGAASAKISYRDALRISKAASKAHGIDRANKRAEKARHK